MVYLLPRFQECETPSIVVVHVQDNSNQADSQKTILLGT